MYNNVMALSFACFADSLNMLNNFENYICTYTYLNLNLNLNFANQKFPKERIICMPLSFVECKCLNFKIL